MRQQNGSAASEPTASEPTASEPIARSTARNIAGTASDITPETEVPVARTTEVAVARTTEVPR